MREHLDAFLEYLALNRGCSANTVLAYRADLGQAVAFFRERLGREPEPADLNKQLVREFLAAQSTRGLAPTTVGRRLAALASFGRYLRRQGLLAGNPTWGLKAPQPVRTLPHVLTRDEVALLLEMPLLALPPLDAVLVAGGGPSPAIPSVGASLRLRDKAILETLYSTGCRAAELVGMDLADLDLDAGLARVRGKGKKERFVVLGPPAVKALRAWLECRPPAVGPDADAVFLGGHRGGGGCHRGRPGKAAVHFTCRLTTRRLDHLFADYVERAGLDPRTTPHTMRHSMATHLLDAGANLRGVQALLGHRKLSMTGYYCQVSIRRLHEAHRKAHPLAGGGPPAPPPAAPPPPSDPPAGPSPGPCPPPAIQEDPLGRAMTTGLPAGFGFELDTDGRREPQAPAV